MNLMSPMSSMNATEVSMPNEHFPWVIFRLQDQFFAISSSYVQSMIELSNFKHVPNAPEYVRGVVDYQGQPVYLIDMRKKIGIQPLEIEIAEFIELMNAREADHKNWLDVLEQCINEGKAFTLATDPNKCRFGQWYLEFLPTVKNNNLSFWLKKFDLPHKRIHGIAQQAIDLLHQDKKELATKLIERTRDGELDKMIKLFAKLKEIYKSSNTETAIIVDQQFTKQPTALLVDQIMSVEMLPREKWRQIDDHISADIGSSITGLAEFKNIQSLVATLDISFLS